MTQPIISESVTNDVDRPTATIITFPIRSCPVPNAAGLGSQALQSMDMNAKELPPQERLARALAKLNAALAEQRAAIAQWRTALGELKTAATQLDGSLQLYRFNLRSLSGRVTSLNTQAKALEQWADTINNK